MDELDRKIISLLQDNGRASNALIARNAGVSEGTVRRRLKRLIQDEIIKVQALPDPEKLGYVAEALVGIQADPDKIDQVADSIAKLPQTRWVAVTTGAFDIFTWVAVPSSEELGIFLRNKVGAIMGVRRTETFVNLTVKKRTYGLAL